MTQCYLQNITEIYHFQHSALIKWGRLLNLLARMGMSPQKSEQWTYHSGTTVSTDISKHSLSFNMTTSVSVHNRTLHRNLKSSYKENPNMWRGESDPIAQKTTTTTKKPNCWTWTSMNNNNSPIVQLTIHVTNSRKNTEHRTAEAWNRTLGCSLPQLFWQMPNSNRTKHHYGRNKGSLDAAFF